MYFHKEERLIHETYENVNLVVVIRKRQERADMFPGEECLLLLEKEEESTLAFVLKFFLVL